MKLKFLPGASILDHVLVSRLPESRKRKTLSSVVYKIGIVSVLPILHRMGMPHKIGREVKCQASKIELKCLYWIVSSVGLILNHRFYSRLYKFELENQKGNIEKRLYTLCTLLRNPQQWGNCTMCPFLGTQNTKIENSLFTYTHTNLMIRCL